MDTIIDQKSMAVPDTREVKDLASDYGLFKRKLDQTLNETVSGFVRTGYYLKIARDTNVLDGSMYSTLSEFAAKEYNLRPDEVSRFIAINDTYSVNGYSPELMEQYRGYGYSKLAEMLTLPPALAEIIEPETTREDIRTLKQEYTQAQEETPIELAIEEQEVKEEREKLLKDENIDAWIKERMPDSDYGHILYEHFRDHRNRERFVELSEFQKNMEEATPLTDKACWEILIPIDSWTMINRVPGKGKMFLNLKGDFEGQQNIVSRDGHKESISAVMILAYVLKLTQPVEGLTAKSIWELIYGEEWKEEPEYMQVPEKKEKPKPNKVEVVKEKPKVTEKEKKSEKIEEKRQITEKTVPKEEEQVISQETVSAAGSEKEKEEIAPAQTEEPRFLPAEEWNRRFDSLYELLGLTFRNVGRKLREYNFTDAKYEFEELKGIFDKITSLPQREDSAQ